MRIKNESQGGAALAGKKFDADGYPKDITLLGQSQDISVFQGINKRPFGTTTWQKALENIRSDKYRKAIENVRAILRKYGSGSPEYRRAKTQLDAVTFGGTFATARAIRNLLSPTGFIVADLDHLKNLELVSRLLTQDKNAWFVFRSPSGEGLKVGIRSQGIKCDADHKRFYFAVERYFKEVYDIEIDPACKDISRLTFVSYDPALWINPGPQYFDIKTWEKPLPDHSPQPVEADFTHTAGKEKYARKVLESCCEQIRQSLPGNQHHTRLKAARLIGGYLQYINEAEVIAALEQAVQDSGAKNMQAAMKTVRDGLEYGKMAPITIPDLQPGPAHGGAIRPGQFDGCSDTDETVGNTETGSGLSDNGKQQRKKVTIEDVVLPIGAFYQLDVSERQEFLFPWLKEDSINLVSGWRGCGKTWFALGILDAVTRGASFGPWECKTPVPCLFLDGEMTVSDDHERIKSLRLNSGRKSPFYFYSDAYANQLGLPRAHLANESWRTKIKSILLSRHIKLWVLDNLASLASGLDENSKKDWDPVNQWLLELRFAGISTIMLHHVNKDGGQRGTSAREDNLDTSIMLKAPHDYTPEDGARFIVHFNKARVQTSRLNLLGDTEFKLILDETGDHTWTCSNVKKETRSEVLRLLDEGMTQTDIKNTLGIHKGTVSKIRTRAIKDGLLTPKNKLTQAGIMAVNG